jgi:hypothetical protein
MSKALEYAKRQPAPLAAYSRQRRQVLREDRDRLVA